MINQNNPSISIIMPTYKQANLISRSIQSVLNQTYTDFEVIIVDDGSKDNTKEVVKSFEDVRIRYISQGENKGVARAHNTSVDFSKGDFISFLGSDDEWHSSKIKKEFKIFEVSDSKVGVVYSGLWEIYNNEKKYFPLPEHILREGYIHDELITGNFVHALSLIRKRCFEKVGTFDEHLSSLEDWELYIRISEYYYFKFIDEPLNLHYLSEDSLTRNLPLQLEATEKIIEKHFNEFNKQKKATAAIYGFLASQLCSNGQLGEGRTYL